MTPEEHALQVELRHKDIADGKARNARAVRHARITVACAVAGFWIIAAGGLWAWAETVLTGAR